MTWKQLQLNKKYYGINLSNLKKQARIKCAIGTNEANIGGMTILFMGRGHAILQ